MGRERLKRDKRHPERGLSRAVRLIYVCLPSLSPQLLDANVQSLLVNYGTAITRSKRLPLPSQSQCPNQNPALCEHVTVTKQSRPFRATPEKHRKSPARRWPLKYYTDKYTDTYKSQHCRFTLG